MPPGGNSTGNPAGQLPPTTRAKRVELNWMALIASVALLSTLPMASNCGVLLVETKTWPKSIWAGSSRAGRAVALPSKLIWLGVCVLLGSALMEIRPL